MLSWIGIGILVLAGLFMVLVDNPGETIGVGDDDLARLVSGVALLIVIGGSMFMGGMGRASDVIKQAVTWLGIALILVVVYSYRAEFTQLGNRVLAELNLSAPQTVAETDDNGEASVVAIRAGRGGSFFVATLVNGTHVEMVADTGASAVVLSNEDAQRIGIDLASLKFIAPISTANGQTYAAATTLDDISVGGITVSNVRALVSQPGVLSTSLLGMTFLRRIGSFELSGDQLILRR